MHRSGITLAWFFYRHHLPILITFAKLRGEVIIEKMKYESTNVYMAQETMGGLAGRDFSTLPYHHSNSDHCSLSHHGLLQQVGAAAIGTKYWLVL